MKRKSYCFYYFLERGFTYFDTAWMYCGFASENATKEALVKRHPRDSFTLTFSIIQLKQSNFSYVSIL